MKNKLLLLLSVSLLLFLSAGDAFSQRIQQKLGRGVVAVSNGSAVNVTWRKLAQEPENALYNVYIRNAGTSEYTLLNTSPLSQTNYRGTTSTIRFNTEIAVATVINGVEQPKSEPFHFKSQFMQNVFLDIRYSSLLSHNDYTTKFVWPADLTGDGEYDFVVDRRSLTDASHKIEAYTRFGEHLWTVDMGPNVDISAGHNDMVIAYDMNCDGKAEVVIKSSDGTRFWDKTNNTWGAYLLGSANGDTDNDGIIDYRTQNVKNPPQYITVIDGLTGTELSTIEMPFPSDGSDTYTRTNKGNYMSDEYSKLNGHMGICYLDGIYPSIAMEYMVRDKNGTHHYYISAWGYTFVNGQATTWGEKFPTWSRNNKSPWPAEFHHIRIADVDLDGRDEILDGGFALGPDGTMLFSAGISHGDRFRVGDIDPDRPGLETFAIQQNAPDMLGQILYDAGTGEAIKKWYLGSVGDVGRGECMDVDPKHKGYEMWSTMGNLYNAKGELIAEGGQPFPREGVWWDGELDREMLCATDGNGYNADIRKFNNTRLIEMAKNSGWTVSAEYGTRPAFFGDIIGDWREEVILRRGGTAGCSGIVGYSTDYAANVSLYCLQQNPAYRMQCTTRGYYQSAYPDYYLGYDMPAPPLPPSMESDLVWKSGNEWSTSSNFIAFDRSSSLPFSDGKSVIFDVSGDDTTPITLTGTLAPSVVYVMAPKGKNYIWSGTGTLSGTMELWKSQNGILTVNVPLAYTGRTIVSEGTLELNTTLPGPLALRAKGTLAGNPTLKGDILFEGGLNYEGCRLSPGTADAPFGTITFDKALTLTGTVYMQMDLHTEGTVRKDYIKVNGNLTLEKKNYLIIRTAEEKPAPGEYPLIEWTGELAGEVNTIEVSGLKGLSYELKQQGKKIVLVINEQRSAGKGVKWTGSVDGGWNFETENFSLSGEATSFVAGDEVRFEDDAVTRAITLNELVETSGVVFSGTKEYTLSGKGGLSGAASLTKEGSGKLTLSAINSDYTGATIISGGTLAVSELSEAGIPGSIGAASAAPANLVLSDATLLVNNTNTATTRGMTLEGEATIQIPGGYTSLKGILTGSGQLIKTGSGQLNVTYSGANTYTGGTVLKAGTLAMGAYNTTFGKKGSPMILSGGAVQIFDNNTTSAIPDFNYAVTVTDGATVALRAGQRCYIDGSFAGSGTVNLSIPYVRTDMLADWSNFTGKLNVTGNQFRLSKGINMQGTAVTLGDGLQMGHYSKGSGTALSVTTQIGSLASTYATATVVNGTYNVGYNNTNATFAGVLSGVSVNKYGEGTWTLTGQNTATINIYGGVVMANAATGVTNTGLINVRSGGILAGSGSVKNVTVHSGGTLEAASSSVLIGKFTIDGTLALNGKLLIKRRGTRNDQLVVFGKVTLKNAVIEVNSSQELSAGDELAILTAGGISGTFSVSPEVPGEGLVWDTSKLLSDGILRVDYGTGLNSIGADGPKIYPTRVVTTCYVDLRACCQGSVTMELYDIEGRPLLVRTFDADNLQELDLSGYPAGVYIISLTAGDETLKQTITKQ